MENIEKLVAEARKVRKLSQARYSEFKVGAALESSDGRIFTGTNVESSSFGLSICAERCALCKALSEGTTDFVRMAIATDSATPTAPCGACRQVLAEHCRSGQILLHHADGTHSRHQTVDLIPFQFKSNALSKDLE